MYAEVCGYLAQARFRIYLYLHTLDLAYLLLALLNEGLLVHKLVRRELLLQYLGLPLLRRGVGAGVRGTECSSALVTPGAGPVLTRRRRRPDVHPV